MRQRSRIVFITHYPHLYGANISLLNILKGLKNSVHFEPILIAPKLISLGDNSDKKTIHDKCLKHNIQCVQFPLWSAVIKRSKTPILERIELLARNLFRLPQFIYTIKSLHPDILVSNSTAISYGYIASRILGIPHILQIREFLDKHFNMEHLLGKKFLKRMIANSEGVVCVSNKLATSTCHSKNKMTILCGIRPESLVEQNQAKSLPKNKSFHIIKVGLIHPMKNQLEAIKAFKLFNNKFPDSKLDIIGDGDDEYLEELSATAEGFPIEFCGYVSDMDAIYKKATMLLMCSKHEASGRVTQEAISFGVPVIGKQSGGTTEMIQNSKCGFTYQENEIELASLMEQLVSNPAQYHELSKSGIDYALNNFTNEISTQRYMTYFSNILNQNPELEKNRHD